MSGGLEHVFNPRSVAVVGASKTPFKIGNTIVWNLVNGFSGDVYPVNPNVKGEIYGCKVYSSVIDVPGEVDLACLAVPREVTLEVLEECGEKGVKGVIVMAAGFSDAGEDGVRLEKELVEVARKYGVRVIGPNSQGIVNVKLGLSTAFAPHRGIVKGGVAIVCQTGTFIACAKYYSQLVGGVSYIVDLANMCDVSFSEVIDFLGNDPETRVIALHLEGIRDGKRFMEVARRISRRKPIVALKSGRSERGAQAVQAHTGSLVGSDKVADAAFKQAGVIRVGCIDELIDVAKAFNILPPMRGRRVGILTFTGGLGVLLVDAIEELGLSLAPLSNMTIEAISAMSESWLKVENPVDMFTACQNKGIVQAYNVALKAMVEDYNVDGIAVIIPHLTGVVEPRDALENVDLRKKPIVVTGNTAAVDDPVAEWRKSTEELEKLGVAVYQDPVRSARVLSALSEYWRNNRLASSSD